VLASRMPKSSRVDALRPSFPAPLWRAPLLAVVGLVLVGLVTVASAARADDVKPPLPAEPGPPAFEADWSTKPLVLEVGVPWSQNLALKSKDDEPVEIHISPVVPGLKLVPARTPYPAALEWTPARGSEGTYELELTAICKHGTSKAYLRLRVSPKKAQEEDAEDREKRLGNRWLGFLYPGVHLASLTTVDSAQYRTLFGAGVEFNLFGARHPDGSAGPGQSRIYVTLSVLKPTGTETAVAVRVGLGAELSFEANATRYYLIPDYGIQLGAFAHKSLESQSLAYVQPQLGMYWYARGALSVGTNVGLFLPISGKYVDSLTGLSLTTMLNAAVW
jgi:hypothetical protein